MLKTFTVDYKLGRERGSVDVQITSGRNWLQRALIAAILKVEGQNPESSSQLSVFNVRKSNAG